MPPDPPALFCCWCYLSQASKGSSSQGLSDQHLAHPSSVMARDKIETGTESLLMPLSIHHRAHRPYLASLLKTHRARQPVWPAPTLCRSQHLHKAPPETQALPPRCTGKITALQLLPTNSWRRMRCLSQSQQAPASRDQRCCPCPLPCPAGAFTSSRPGLYPPYRTASLPRSSLCCSCHQCPSPAPCHQCPSLAPCHQCPSPSPGPRNAAALQSRCLVSFCTAGNT